MEATAWWPKFNNHTNFTRGLSAKATRGIPHVAKHSEWLPATKTTLKEEVLLAVKIYWNTCMKVVRLKQPESGTYCFVIPLSHYSRNAPRIHNVGHIFQIAKVPSGVCKIRPAFLLDSATFLAIANACGNVQGGTCVSGRHFIFSKIREFVKNPIQQTYERTNTIRWSKNPTGH